MWHLTKGIVGFNELQRKIGNVTQKTLSMQLKQLEEAQIIYRKVYPEVPPRVEYGLTKMGESMQPILTVMCEWGKEYQKNVNSTER